MPSYCRRFFNFYKNRINLLILIAFSIFILLVLGVGLYFKYVVQNTINTQYLNRQLIIARAGTNSIEGFLDLVGKSMVLLAKEPSIVSPNPQTQSDLNNLVSDWQNTPIMGVLLADGNGKIIYGVDKLGNQITDQSIADRKYFTQAKIASPNTIIMGDSVVNRFGAYKGQYLIPLATPVYQGETVKGVLVIGILNSELTQAYLDPLKLTQTTQVFIVSKEGKILTSPYEDLVGQGMIEFLEKYPFSISKELIKIIQNHLASYKENKLILTWPDLNDRNKLIKFLLAYSTIDFQNQSYFLAVATPSNDIFNFYQSYKSIAAIGLIILYISIVIMTFIIVLILKQVEIRAYYMGVNCLRFRNAKTK